MHSTTIPVLQFGCRSPEIVEWTKAYDPSRLVNPASGGNHYHVGDMLDIHHYPGPEIKLMDGERANVLGEYGGIGLIIPDHIRHATATGVILSSIRLRKLQTSM